MHGFLPCSWRMAPRATPTVACSAGRGGGEGGHRWHNSVKLTQSVCCCFPAADAVSGTGEANKALPCARVSHGSAGLTGSWRNGQAFPLVHKPRAK